VFTGLIFLEKNLATLPGNKPESPKIVIINMIDPRTVFRVSIMSRGTTRRLGVAVAVLNGYLGSIL
jgi:hypothetical protein